MIGNAITHDSNAFLVREVDKDLGVGVELSHYFVKDGCHLQLVVYHDIVNGVGTPWPSQNTLNRETLRLVVRVFDDFLACWPLKEMPTDLVRALVSRRKGYAHSANVL